MLCGLVGLRFVRFLWLDWRVFLLLGGCLFGLVLLGWLGLRLCLVVLLIGLCLRLLGVLR